MTTLLTRVRNLYTSIMNLKSSIKTSIKNKGVAVDDSLPFSSYPDKIDEISQGGAGTHFISNVSAVITSHVETPEKIISNVSAVIKDSISYELYIEEEEE